MAAHLIATVLELALGGPPAQWLYFPDRPERIAAPVIFSVGEELGWRGFAWPLKMRLRGAAAVASGAAPAGLEAGSSRELSR